VADPLTGTPHLKIRYRFPRHKHTSFACLVEGFCALRMYRYSEVSPPQLTLKQHQRLVHLGDAPSTRCLVHWWRLEHHQCSLIWDQVGTEMADHTSVPAARIIIADDHPLYRSALRSLLENSRDIELVAEASDGQEALELCRRFEPDLVLMDLRMPKVDGLEATRAIKRELPRTAVSMMTASEEPKHLAESIKAGAAGYVLKTASQQQMTDAIRRALGGESPLDQEIARQLISSLLDEVEKERPSELAEKPPHGDRRSGEALPSSLTAREAEVLRLVTRGLSNQQIAQTLLLSTSTAKKHMRHIISKLGVSDRTQAAVRASELGLRPDRDA
jgi:DNA-binding NarL/FixJ family response regulator